MKILTLAFVVLGAAAAQAEITVFVNEKLVTFPDMKPVIQQKRVMVPLRPVLVEMGIEVRYTAADKMIHCTMQDLEVTLQLDSQTVDINGQGTWTDVPPQAKSGRVYMPLRFISEAFGATVNWQPAGQVVNITSQASQPAEGPPFLLR